MSVTFPFVDVTSGHWEWIGENPYLAKEYPGVALPFCTYANIYISTSM